MKNEIDAIRRNATVRGDIISLLAFSGLRPETRGNYGGSDALRIKDIGALSISPEGVEFFHISGNSEGQSVEDTAIKEEAWIFNLHSLTMWKIHQGLSRLTHKVMKGHARYNKEDA